MLSNVKPFLVGLVAIAAACVAPSDERSGGFLEEEVLARRAELIRVTDMRDWDAVGMLHAQDAILLPPSGRVIRGRESIQAFLTSPPDVTTTDVDYSNLQVSGTDSLAYVVATYGYTVIRGADTTRIKGPYAAVWRRHPVEGWQIQVMSWHCCDRERATASRNRRRCDHLRCS